MDREEKRREPDRELIRLQVQQLQKTCMAIRDTSGLVCLPAKDKALNLVVYGLAAVGTMERFLNLITRSPDQWEPDDFAVEVADAVVQLVVFADFLGVDLGGAIVQRLRRD